MILILTRIFNKVLKRCLLENTSPSPRLKPQIKLTFITDSTGGSEETTFPYGHIITW